jgi:PDZ domain-containing secreted protein
MTRDDDWPRKTLEEVAREMAGASPDSQRDQEARAEFHRRQTEYFRQSADAAKGTAKSTAQYTQWMFCSVVLLALSVLGSLVLDFLRFVQGR